MFSITVFSVVVLAGYASQFESHSSGFVDEASGDFEILLSSSRQSPLDLSSNPSEWPLQLTNASDIDAVGQVQRATVWIENANESRIGYVLRGFDVGFAQHGGLPLSEWDNRYGSTEHEVWQNVSSRPDLVLVDASFLLIDPLSGEALSGLKISIGESISLIDVSNAGKRQNVVVAGVLSESSNLFSSGIWLNATTSENFGGSLTRVYVSHGEGVDAKQLSENLNRDLASTGVSVTLIEEEILEIQSLVFAILSIFQSYLSWLICWNCRHGCCDGSVSFRKKGSNWYNEGAWFSKIDDLAKFLDRSDLDWYAWYREWSFSRYWFSQCNP